MRSLTLLRPYYYGDRKWDNYLLDIEEAVQSGNSQQRQAVRLQAEALDVGREQLDELRGQTASLVQIQDTLQTGFDELRAEFQWGFTLLADRMDRQIELMARVAAKLEAIHKTLQSPLVNQARELFRIGQERLGKGLLDKALEALLQSEQKNDVDFLLQLQIGKLYLYGRDTASNVIDLPQAERHLLLAARYADAERSTIPDWNEYCGQAYFHAAVAAYLLGEQERTDGRPDAMRECLDRALRYLAKAVALWPQFIESNYTRAKCHALLGHGEEVRRELEILSDRDRRYFAKATEDKDFDSFRSDVKAVFQRVTVSPGPLAQALQVKLHRAVEALQWARFSRPDSKADIANLDAIDRYFGGARQALRGLDIDLVKMDARLSETITALGTLADGAFRARMSELQAGIKQIQSEKSSREGAIKSLLTRKNATEGSWGIGCGSGFLVLIVLAVLFDSLGIDKDKGFGVIFVLSIIACIAGYVASWQAKARPLEQEMETLARKNQECDHKLALAKQRVAELQAEIDKFASWRSTAIRPT